MGKFKPSSDDFDPVLAMEVAGNPFYYRFGADTNSSRHVALDVAVFGTHANFQNERQMALAASVRIGQK